MPSISVPLNQMFDGFRSSARFSARSSVATEMAAYLAWLAVLLTPALLVLTRCGLSLRLERTGTVPVEVIESHPYRGRGVAGFGDAARSRARSASRAAPMARRVGRLQSEPSSDLLRDGSLVISP